MKECDIYGTGVKTYIDPSYIISGDQDPRNLHDLRPAGMGIILVFDPLPLQNSSGNLLGMDYLIH